MPARIRSVRACCAVASTSREPPARTSAAAPKPAIAATGSSPARRARSWSPPSSSGRSRRPAAHEERADARRTAELVGRHGEQVEAQLVEGDGDLPCGLRGVDVQEHATLAARIGDLGDGLQRGDLVVAPLEVHERGVGSDRVRGARRGRPARARRRRPRSPSPRASAERRTAECSTAARTWCSPRSAPPQQAAAIASVAPLVKTTERGRRRAARPPARARSPPRRAPPGPPRGCARDRRPARRGARPSRPPPRAAAATSTRGRGSAGPSTTAGR